MITEGNLLHQSFGMARKAYALRASHFTATTRSWSRFAPKGAITNTMLKHLGVGRAAGGEKPPKSEGGGNER